MPSKDYDEKGCYADPYIFLSDGSRFYLNRPAFEIDTVAHALCNNVRFNGHIRISYSVGQHSMLVAAIVRRLVPDGAQITVREALLHDATESIMSDIPAPFKKSLPDWKAVDKQLDAAMREQFGLPAEKSAVVVLADWYALFIEAERLLPAGCSKQFEDPLNLHDMAVEFGRRTKVADYFIEHMYLPTDKRRFLEAYKRTLL